MTKTLQTTKLETALEQRSVKRREYGCTEVTIGFAHNNHGDEIVDYMTMDAQRIFKCYEIKVTLADLRTDNKKSWYGDYNYLVVSESLWMRNVEWDNYIPGYVGILVGEGLIAQRQAKKKQMPEDDRMMLEDSLLRSVYWKMVQYKTTSDESQYKDLQKKYEEKEQAFAQFRQSVDAQMFNTEDYETYYAKNHQLESVSLASQAKNERKQYFQRIKGALTWQEQRCPMCGKQALQNSNGDAILTNYCPFCGTDLRKLGEGML